MFVIEMACKTQFIDIKRGYGRKAVLIPGWATDGRIFGRLNIDYDYKVVNMINLDTFYEDLAAQSLNPQTDIVIGWSFGGVLASHFAYKHPDCVKKLILVGVRMNYRQSDMYEMREYLSSKGMKYLPAFYRKCFAGQDKSDWKWFSEELLDSYSKGIYETGELDRFLEYMEMNPIPIPTADLTKFGVDVTFVYGDGDHIAGVDEEYSAQRLFPGKTYIIDKAGHAVFLNGGFEKICNTL